MNINKTVEVLASLAQETRLMAFHLLIRSGPEGMAAGDIARSLEVPHNTMSAHLAVLRNAGLVCSSRKGRSIIYKADFEATKGFFSSVLNGYLEGDPDFFHILKDIVNRKPSYA